MAHCDNCGNELQKSSKFCPECGQAVKVRETERKISYEGEVHKCPNCGEVLKSFEAYCSACGYELRGINSTSSVKTLAMKLEQLSLQRSPKATKTVFSQALSGGDISCVDEQIIDLIKNFAIPNTLEDVREFAILAYSNIDTQLYSMQYDSSQLAGKVVAGRKAISDAWLSKLQQTYQKSQLMFGDGEEFKRIKSMYEEKAKAIKAKKRQMPMFLGIFFGVVILFIIVMICLN